MSDVTLVSVGANLSFNGSCFAFGDEEAEIYNRLREKRKDQPLFTLACCTCGRKVSFLFTQVVEAVERQIGENIGFVYTEKEEIAV